MNIDNYTVIILPVAQIRTVRSYWPAYHASVCVWPLPHSKKIDPIISVVTKMKELKVNDLVEFDLHGSRVIGTLIKFEDGKRVVRYWLDKIIKLLFY